MTARYALRPSSDLPVVYVYRNPIDFRKGHRGLSAIVQMELGHDPFEGALFVFRNRSLDKLKILFLENNGFVLYYSVSSIGWNIQKGESPFRGNNLNPLAWVAGWRVTNILKPTDKAVHGAVSESSGRNVNERIGGLVKTNSNGRAPCNRANAANRIEMRSLRSDSLAGY